MSWISFHRLLVVTVVKCLDDAVTDVVKAYKDGGLWDNTVLVFTTDNGGIGIGNNFPLRGMKV